MAAPPVHDPCFVPYVMVSRWVSGELIVWSPAAGHPVPARVWCMVRSGGVAAGPHLGPGILAAARWSKEIPGPGSRRAP